jgi:hypothetical protein
VRKAEKITNQLTQFEKNKPFYKVDHIVKGSKPEDDSKPLSMTVRPSVVIKENKEKIAEKEEKLAIMKIPKKKRLYSKIIFGKKRKAKKVKKLKAKRQLCESKQS